MRLRPFSDHSHGGCPVIRSSQEVRLHRRDFTRSLLAASLAGPRAQLGALGRPQLPLHVDGTRLNAQLAALSEFGKTSSGTNRVAYSDADLEGRAYVEGLMREAGLETRVDPAGNLLGRRAGTGANLPVILIGSHIDSVDNGGNYDGDVGSLAAIEVARTLGDARLPLRHPLEVVVFQNEEGGTVGSKLMASGMTDAELHRATRSGVTLRDGIVRLGGDPARLAAARRRRGDLLCYVELHIEQGGILDGAGIPIGIVQGIVGIRWFEVTFTGFANHAGTTPMDQRQDAMLAAAKFTVAVNEAVRAEPGRQVATVGRLIPTPGTVNVIPGEVTLTVDLRDLSTATLTLFTQRFEEIGRGVAAETRTTFAMRTVSTNEPAPTDPRLQRIIGESARQLGFATRALPSGAGHDAQEIAAIAPVGMIFVPSVGGISHSPKEFTKPEDVANGANVLLHTILSVDRDGL